jgi:hypothetical protein
LLSDNTAAVTTVHGGSGGLFVDLTSLTPAAAHALITVDGGTGLGEVAFNNAMLTTDATVALSNIDVLDDASNTQGGTINMSDFPLVPTAAAFTLRAGGTVPAGFEVLQLLNAHGGSGTTLTQDLVINNAPANFAVNMQDTSFSGNNVTITAGPTISTTGTLDLWVSDEGAVPTFTVNNYTTTNIFLPTEGDTVTLGSTAFVDQPVVSVTNASLNFFDNTADTGGPSDTLKLGHITDLGVGDIGVATVQLDSTAPTTINFNGAGEFVIGATDVTNLNAGSSSHLVMDLAGTNTADGITVVGSATGQNLLQGTSGPVTLDLNGHLATDLVYSGAVGNDTITGGAGADNIFGEGGNDTINLNSTNSTVWIGAYDVGSTGTGVGATHVQAITDISGAGVESFVNGYGSDITTVNGFVLGPTGDVLNFNPSS